MGCESQVSRKDLGRGLQPSSNRAHTLGQAKAVMTSTLMVAERGCALACICTFRLWEVGGMNSFLVSLR